MAARLRARTSAGPLLRHPRLWLAGALALVSVPLAAHVYAGSFARILADTYCYTAETMRYGLWGMLVYEYHNWSGRYTHYILEGLSTLRGTGALPFLPPMAVLLWLLALVALFWPARRWLPIAWGALGPLLLGAVALCAALSASPHIQSSLYWTDGSHNYTAPLVLLTALLAVISQRAARPGAGWRAAAWPLAGFVLAFLAAGSTEMVGALQIVVLVLLIGALLWLGSPELRRRLLPLLVAALAGAVVGLAIVASAPGNLVRLEGNNKDYTLLQLAWVIVQATFICAGIAAKAGPLALLVAVGVPATLGGLTPPEVHVTLQQQRSALRALLVIPPITGLLLAASLAPAVYGLGGLPPARSVLVVAFVLTLGLMAWGYALGRALSPRLRTAFAKPRAQTGGLAVAALLLVLMAVTEIMPVARLQPHMAAYAAAWDRNNAQIIAARESGAATVSVPALPDPFGDSGKEWDASVIIAACIDAYYGLTVVRTPPEP